MKKIADIIVEKRIFIITAVLALTIFCGFHIPKVNINDDMTKYLSDDSSMKVGMDIMDEYFPETETDNTIRVMFKWLDRSERLDMKEKLSEIQYVSSVDYKKDSEDYNKEPYTKYVLHMKYDYGSSQEKAITQTLENDFSTRHMTYMNDSGKGPGLPLWVMVFAVSILMVILLIMSGSWFEPILFLFTIAVAVVMNLGTNIILGTISENTFSCAAILQLVLSMDYSIILINRYRQELENNSNKEEAMKSAIAGAFSSISSSSVTTIVGLLALVFMSFKIGFDMGVVLAKGVLCSVICVFLILPGLILLFSKVIEKTSKPVLHIPTSGLAKFCNKLRIPLTLCFIALFAGAYILQQKTVIGFSMTSPDVIADVFPTQNTVVMLYENRDDNAVTYIADKLKKRDDVKSAVNYTNSLGRSYNSNEIVDVMNDLSDNMGSGNKQDFDLDPSLFNMLYYKYYGFEAGKINAGTFLRFLANNVVNNPTFSSYMGKDISGYSEMLSNLSDAALLKTPMDAAELAKFFDMNKGDCEQLVLYYFIQNGGATTKKLTIGEFTDFVLNDLSNDKAYADMFDKNTLDQMKLLSEFANESPLKNEYTAKEISSMLGFNEETAKTLFVYYYGKNSRYSPKAMTIQELTTFLKNDVAKNKAFAFYFSSDTLSQLDLLSVFTNRNAIHAERDASDLAEMLGMDENIIRQILRLDVRDIDIDNETMNVEEFVSFLDSVMNDPLYSDYFDSSLRDQTNQLKRMVWLASSDQALSVSELAGMFGVDENFLSQLFKGYSEQVGYEVRSMPLGSFINYILDDVLPYTHYGKYFDDASRDQLYMMNNICNATASGKYLDSFDIAQLFGMDENQTRLLYTLYFGDADKEMSLYDFIDYITNYVVDDPMFSDKIDGDKAQKIAFLKQIMDLTTYNTRLSFTTSASLLNMDSAVMKQLYALKESKTTDWKISLQSLVDFLTKNKKELSAFADAGSLGKIDMLKAIKDSALAKEMLDAKRLSQLTAMEINKADQLLMLYTYKTGNTGEWKLSVQKFMNLLTSDILNNKDFSDKFDADTSKKLTSLSLLVNAVISDRKYTVDEMTSFFSGLTNKFDKNTVSLLYLYHDANVEPDSRFKMSIIELMNFLSDKLIYDETFSAVLDDEMKEDIKQSAKDLNDSIKQLKGTKYSRLILTVTVPEEGKETEAFYDDLNNMCSSLKGDYHIIGSSAMNYEMSQTFDKELLTITLLTAIAIFLVVLITFRSAAVPAILVLLVQCGVYITISVIGLQGYSIHYLALLIVQCILMGSTIDYAILFSTYYREHRKNAPPSEALKEAFSGSMHTILTSGLIMVTITGILGQCFGDPTVEQICRTLSIGAACAIFLIIFILPGILTCLDNFTAGKNRMNE